jgi:hypothetical protein
MCIEEGDSHRQSLHWDESDESHLELIVQGTGIGVDVQGFRLPSFLKRSDGEGLHLSCQFQTQVLTAVTRSKIAAQNGFKAPKLSTALHSEHKIIYIF